MIMLVRVATGTPSSAAIFGEAGPSRNSPLAVELENLRPGARRLRPLPPLAGESRRGGSRLLRACGFPLPASPASGGGGANAVLAASYQPRIPAHCHRPSRTI